MDAQRSPTNSDRYAVSSPATVGISAWAGHRS